MNITHLLQMNTRQDIKYNLGKGLIMYTPIVMDEIRKTQIVAEIQL